MPPNPLLRRALLACSAAVAGDARGATRREPVPGAAFDTPAASLLGFALAAVVALVAIGLLGANGAPLRRLAVPVEGVRVADLRDAFDAVRPGHRRQAIDIAAPRGTRVLAADDGTLVKLLAGAAGGATIYQLDPDRRFAYAYAHLDRYADGLREGMALRRGDVIGYVGTSGNAPAAASHVRFAVFRLGPEKAWWRGEAIDPFDALD